MSIAKRKNLVSRSMYKYKCPYKMEPNTITIHNTDNNASAFSEVAYMRRNTHLTSFHWAVDEKEAVQGIPTTRNAWHSGDGNGDGNRKSISVEICRSTGSLSVFKKCEKNAAIFVAELLHHRNWGVDRLRRHYDWSGKDCPHMTMKLGWLRFVNMVQEELYKLDDIKVVTKKTYPRKKNNLLSKKYSPLKVGTKVHVYKETKHWSYTNYKWIFKKRLK